MGKAEKLRSQAKIVITAEDSEREQSFGKGVITLLRDVVETGSLNKAAKKQHMAYSKAWRIIKNVEKSIGFDLMERHGGAGSVLTEDGMRFLDLYEEFDTRVSEYSDNLFKEIFKDF